MGEKKKALVVINGQTHGFMVDGDEAPVLELGEYVNAKIQEVAELPSGRLLPNDKKYIFAAMNMAEEIFELKAKYEEVFEKRSENYDELKEKYNKVVEENRELKEKNDVLSYELDFVQSAYEHQKAEHEQLLKEYNALEQLLEKETAPSAVVTESEKDV